MIDELFTEQEIQSGLLCKAFSRHLFDGNIYQQKGADGQFVWRETFECEWCLTIRVTLVEVGTGIPIGGRQYSYTREFDRTRTNDQARQEVTQRIFRANRNKKLAVSV